MINYYNIDKEFKRIKNVFFKSVEKECSSGNFILGQNLYKFEKNLSKLLGSKYVLGVANGTDALELAMMSLGIGNNHEVITAPNSFVSTANAIVNVGAKPVFVDIDNSFNIDPDKIIKKITKKTKAIIPVHLNGFPACMKKINLIAKKYNLYVIEDAAQSILAKIGKKYTGTLGDIGCFSLHPTKNLGAIGDAGFVTTQNKNIYEKIKFIRNHGLRKFDETILIGRNSRLDEIQAIALNLKLKYLKSDTKKKINLAKVYYSNLANINSIILPLQSCCQDTKHVYHRFVIRCLKKRDKLYRHLLSKGVQVKIHYSRNIHLQKSFRNLSSNNGLNKVDNYSKQILSLPINQFNTKREIEKVCKLISDFYS